MNTSRMHQSQEVEAYSQLLVANQHRIYGFIYTLVHDHSAASDILQDVASLLWQKFDRYEPGTDFGAWAMSIARLTILNWRRRQKKMPLSLDEEQFSLLADEAVAVSCELEDRRQALEICLQNLAPDSQRLLAERYEMNLPVARIAELTGASRVAVHKRLGKIHRFLLNCINGRLQPETCHE